jgi:hypothetical protein
MRRPVRLFRPAEETLAKTPGNPVYGATRFHVHDYPHMKLPPARLFSGVAILARGLEGRRI